MRISFLAVYVLLTVLVVMLAACDTHPVPIGPPPQPTSARQLQRLDGTWAVTPHLADAPALPFTRLIITGAGSSVSTDAPGSSARLTDSKYLRPYPGGTTVRATFTITVNAANYVLWVNWDDSGSSPHFGQLTPPAPGEPLMVHITAAPIAPSAAK